ncbi:hypothetical protein M747DRAFT_15671 [Aspergillus niger ATCC 13496]|uniref:Uncharacterized protein n=1 Tax=Aspergillus niger ATCC 13496 TaxID=1353008 RepID=A0A370C6P2_ASPNG|nr:hypothetical protein M747DRAFT_15671 [Aspergillus niger ATCC 13496]
MSLMRFPGTRRLQREMRILCSLFRWKGKNKVTCFSCCHSCLHLPSYYFVQMEHTVHCERINNGSTRLKLRR